MRPFSRRPNHAEKVREVAARDLLLRTLRALRYTLAAHPCSSCQVDYDILSQQARELGVEVERQYDKERP